MRLNVTPEPLGREWRRSQRPVPTSRIEATLRRGRRVATTGGRACLYPRWPPTRPLTEGYTVLMPMPGDLPVFVELALAGLAHQNPAGHVETLIIPDRIRRRSSGLLTGASPAASGAPRAWSRSEIAAACCIASETVRGTTTSRAAQCREPSVLRV